MSDAEAKIKVTVLADEAKRAAADLKRDWKDTAQVIANAWRAVASAAGSAAQQTLASVGRIATAADLISLDKAIASTLDFNATFGKMAVSSGRSLDTLKKDFSSLGLKILETPQAAASAARALNRHTYDMGKSVAAISAVGQEGLFTDRSIGEMSEFIKLLSMGANNAAQMVGQLDKLRGTASRLPAKGGATAVEDWGNANPGMLGKMTGTVASGARGDALALRAAMPKELTPEQADEATSAILGPIMANPNMIAKRLGKKPGSFTDKYGLLNVSPLKIAKMMQKTVMREAGGDPEKARWIAGNVHGALGGGVLTGLDFSEIEKAQAGAAAASRIPAMLADSPELAEARTRIKAAAAELKRGTHVTNKTSRLREWMVEHPTIAGIGNSAWNLASSGAGNAVEGGVTAAGAYYLGGAGLLSLGGGFLAGAGGGTVGGAVGMGIDWGLDKAGVANPYTWAGDKIAAAAGEGSFGAPLTPDVLAAFGLGGGTRNQNSLPTAIGEAVAAALGDSKSTQPITITVQDNTMAGINASIDGAKQSGAQ